jgi:hypothetical protein
MENLEDKSLKELFEIRDNRILLRIKEYKEEQRNFFNGTRGIKVNVTFPDPYGTLKLNGEIWHKDDDDIWQAVCRIREQEKNLQALRDVQDVIGTNLNKRKVDEPRIPIVVWVGIALIILLILNQLV